MTNKEFFAQESWTLLPSVYVQSRREHTWRQIADVTSDGAFAAFVTWKKSLSELDELNDELDELETPTGR